MPLNTHPMCATYPTLERLDELESAEEVRIVILFDKCGYAGVCPKDSSMQNIACSLQSSLRSQVSRAACMVCRRLHQI